MIVALVLLLLCGAGRALRTYPLSDIQYAAPVCIVNNFFALVNSFGAVTLDNTLLPRALQLTVRPDASQRSCRFCAVSSAYCTTPFGANAPNETALHLAYDTSYNIKLISRDARGNTVAFTIALPRGTNAVSIDGELLAAYAARGGAQGTGAADLCGKTYRLTLLAIMRTEAPAPRDFLVVARDAAAPLALPCSADPTRADISCRVAPAYYYLDYAVQNCLSGGDGAAAAPPALLSHHSLYYYYYEAVAMRNSDALPALVMCGESWESIYARARLELYCGGDVELYVTLLPWYSTALVTMAAWQNGRRDAPLWAALEVLEQYCAVRDLLVLGDLWANTSAAMLDPASEWLVERAVLCEWAALAAQESNTSAGTQNVTLPFYYYNSRAWYFRAFLYMFYFDAAMPAKSAAAVAFFVAVGLTVLFGIAFTAFALRRRHAPPGQYSLI